MWCDVVSCLVVSCDAWRGRMWCDAMWCWRAVTWCDVMWQEVLSRNLTWCDVMWSGVGETKRIEKHAIWGSAHLPNFHQMLRLPRKVTLQHHQILPMPRKVTGDLPKIYSSGSQLLLFLAALTLSIFQLPYSQLICCQLLYRQLCTVNYSTDSYSTVSYATFLFGWTKSSNIGSFQLNFLRWDLLAGSKDQSGVWEILNRTRAPTASYLQEA